MVVIVQVAVVVVVKSGTGPELVNNKLEAGASKCKFGPMTAKHQFGARGGKHIFRAWDIKYKLEARPGKHKLGPQQVNTNWGPGTGARAGGQGQGQGANQRAGGREIQIPNLISILHHRS